MAKEKQEKKENGYFDSAVAKAQAKRQEDLEAARKKGRWGRFLSGFSKEELDGVSPANRTSATTSQQKTKPSPAPAINAPQKPGFFSKIAATFSEKARRKQEAERREERREVRNQIAEKYNLDDKLRR